MGVEDHREPEFCVVTGWTFQDDMEAMCQMPLVATNRQARNKLRVLGILLISFAAGSSFSESRLDYSASPHRRRPGSPVANGSYLGLEPQTRAYREDLCCVSQPQLCKQVFLSHLRRVPRCGIHVVAESMAAPGRSATGSCPL